jgi:sulfonate transport system substrate-binding protein
MRRLWALIVFGSMNLTACDETESARHDASGAAVASPREAGGQGSTGDATDGDAEPDGSEPPAHLDAGTIDTPDSAGSEPTPRADAAPQRDTGTPAPTNLPSLRISSDTASIEFTPALYAARNLYPGTATVVSGGIANLFGGGGADLGTNAETPALRQSATNPNLRIICTVTETFYRIVARRSAGIAQLADLRGKRVGTVPNTSAHYYLGKMLGTVGLSATDVSVVSAFPLSRMASMLQGGQVDAVTSWEPEPQRAADALGSDAIEFQDRAVYREIVNLHSTEEKLADPEKRRGIVAFVRALIRAADIFQNQPEQALPLVSEALDYPQDLLRKVWHLERFPGRLVADMLDVLEEEEPWVARQTGRTPRTRAQLAELIDESVLEEALAEP